MTGIHLGELLLELGGLLGLSYLLAGLLARVRIPGILGALFVGMIARYTPLGDRVLAPPVFEPLSVLAQLGVLFLLFFIGLQIDLRAIRALGPDIARLTALNTAGPFLLGSAGMFALGYDWRLAVVIGMALMPTAEAVIVPILDEFRLVRTRVGQLIIAAGLLDDVIEVLLIAGVSAWVGHSMLGGGGSANPPVIALAGLIALGLLAWLGARWLVPELARWLPPRPQYLALLAITVLLAFGGLAEASKLGLVVGGITAGVVMRPAFDGMGAVGEQVLHGTRSVAYGLLGMTFFLWIGLRVDLTSIASDPRLALTLCLAALFGKIGGAFLMVPMGRLTPREAWTVGVGLNARLTTELIVGELLLRAGVIDTNLFSALAALSAISTVVTPLLFAVLVRRSGSFAKALPGASRPRPASRRRS